MKKLLFIFICSLLLGAGQAHKKRSTLTDDGDSTRVQIKDWNAPHIYNPATSAFFYDDFMGGLNTSNNIGKGWSFITVGGGIAQIAAVADHNGLCSLGIAAAANNYIALRSGSSANIAPISFGGSATDQTIEMVWIVKPNQDTSNNSAHYRFGLVDSSKADTIRPDNGIYLERLGGTGVTNDSLWGVTRNGNTENRINLVSFRNTAWYRVKMRIKDVGNSSTDSVGFTVGNGTEVMAVVTNIPNSPDFLQPYLAVGNSNTAAANEMFLDYFHVGMMGLNR